MAKCSACGERKGNRLCVALTSSICSLCCGTKRQKEIRCQQTCEYLKKGEEYQLDREISKKIGSDLHLESEDVFQMDDVTPFVEALERFFVDQFYRGREVDDNHIYDSLAKIYAFRTGTITPFKVGNKTEEVIFNKFSDLNKRFSHLSDSVKSRAILRIIKSIRSSSGGVLGNRNYLEMVYSQHTGKGKWAELFSELETKG